MKRVIPFGLGYSPTHVDRFGIWLSIHQIRSAVRDFRGLRVADIGCSYDDALFACTILPEVQSLTLADLGIAEDLTKNPKIRVLEGRLPDSLASREEGSQDVVVCNSVVEHLLETLDTLSHLVRICATGGLVLINVPTCRGKWFLEFAAFRLGIAPEAETDDHKMYYDPPDLWPLLVRSGFRPKNIKLFKHKFGLDTFAICSKTATAFSIVEHSQVAD
jgi:2-polyprenyl-3-methyl-5-hydroxy-6-metoxy-1,4-benzoquinol methylase